MACCGGKRSHVVMNGQLSVASLGKSTIPTSHLLLFEYTGQTAMTVVGGATGRTYRFLDPGARVQIDGRDVQSLSAVPNLKRLR
jgi:hypothetical protein